MGVNRGIASSSGEVLSLPVGDVLAVALDVPLGQSEVQDEDLVGSLVESNAEVIGLDVAMDEVSVVDVLNPGDHLVDEHEHSLEGELAQRLVEEGLEGGAHEIHDQHVKIAYF